MIQLLQNFGSGITEAVKAPCPATAGGVLVRSRASMISAGTERMLIEFGKANWIEKARQQPDKVRMVLDKARVDGLFATFESVQAKLDQAVPLGYSNAGVVLAIGAGVKEFKPGDRVITNGPHAEVVDVAKNLCAKIPDGVPDEAAACTVVASIALQGVRLAEPTLGECFAVTGLGLIGLMTVQILRAHGCRVLGIDFTATNSRWPLASAPRPLISHLAKILSGRPRSSPEDAASTACSSPQLRIAMTPFIRLR